MDDKPQEAGFSLHITERGEGHNRFIQVIKLSLDQASDPSEALTSFPVGAENALDNAALLASRSLLA